MFWVRYTNTFFVKMYIVCWVVENAGWIYFFCNLVFLKNIPEVGGHRHC